MHVIIFFCVNIFIREEVYIFAHIFETKIYFFLFSCLLMYYTGLTPKLRHIEFETLSIYLKITLVKIKIYKKFFFD